MLAEADLAWLRIAAALCDPTPIPPATEAEIVAAEQQLGRTFPADFRWWLANVGATAAVGHDLVLNTSLLPPSPEECHEAVTTAADQLREWDWEIPQELIVFGVEGSGEPFGLWLPSDGEAIPAVVLVGSGHQDDDPLLWIVGDSFTAFLRGWLGCYADSFDDPEAAYRLLEIPTELQDDGEEFTSEELQRRDHTADADGDDRRVREILRLASPSLGDWVTDPWNDRRLSADDLRRILNTPA